MVYTITPQEMRSMEQDFLARSHMPSLLLMEHAALALQPFLKDAPQALFLCGLGNNGGDGLAAARQYAANGGHPLIWLAGPRTKLQGDALTNAQILTGLGIPIQELDAPPPIPPVDCIVDALFGTGLDRPITGLPRDLIHWANQSQIPILAADMPSGIDGATGQILGCAIQATHTVTFHRPKPGHYLFPGRMHTGQLHIAPLGIPQAMDPLPGMEILSDSDALSALPPRPANAHKGSFGHVLAIAGSRGMAGAAALCAQAALHSGTGLVTLACPDSILDTLQQLVPCAMAMPLHDALSLEKTLQNKTSVALGPGYTAPLATLAPLWDCPLPQVWDAGALNLLAVSGKKPPKTAILTPHPGEAARLLSVPIAQITAAPVEAAQALARNLDALVLLKGATTIITDGTRTALNISGCPGLAQGGSGDVLTGLIASLLAQGMSPWDATTCGAHLHGRAGERASQALGQRTLTAWDLPNYLFPKNP